MRSVMGRMDMHAEVDSYRPADQLCGTTPTTVMRAVLAAEAGPDDTIRPNNYDDVRLIVAQRVEKLPVGPGRRL